MTLLSSADFFDRSDVLATLVWLTHSSSRGHRRFQFEMLTRLSALGADGSNWCDLLAALIWFARDLCSKMIAGDSRSCLLEALDWFAYVSGIIPPLIF